MGKVGGRRKYGEISSDGWWYKETGYLPCDKDGRAPLREGTHLIGKLTRMADVIEIKTRRSSE